MKKMDSDVMLLIGLVVFVSGIAFGSFLERLSSLPHHSPSTTRQFLSTFKPNTMEKWNYLFATKDKQTVIVRCVESWYLKAVDCLFDEGYKVRSATQLHWAHSIDENGETVHKRYQLGEEQDSFVLT